MYHPQSNNNSRKTHSHPPFKKHWKRNKRNKEGHMHKKKIGKKNIPKLESIMSTWAENFTVAATWQLKHQIAYWKARAKSVEYENAILHDIIRKHNIGIPSTMGSCNDINSGTHSDTLTDNDIESNVSSDREENFEVSEEFITFLASNAKYKAEAKRERERLKAEQEAKDKAENEIEYARESVEENRKRLENLYGDKWQKIAALEMSLMSTYINKCDKSSPAYWPYIPFNFN